MFPLLSLLVAVALGLHYRQAFPEGPAPNLLGAAAVVLLYGAAARLLYERAVRRSVVRGVSPGICLLRVALPVRVGAILAYGIVLYQFHWPGLVPSLGLGEYVLVDEILIFAPYVALVLLSILASWSGESRLEVHSFDLRSYVAFQGRQYLLPVLPILVFLLGRDVVALGLRSGIEWVAELDIHYEAYPFLQWLTLGGFLLLLYCTVPFLIRVAWGAGPLPAGPLRDRLTDFSRREGFRARDILVWPTGGNVMNAAVIGVAGPFRYVLLTDALLEALPDDEVEAVFAHEVGHAKHRHMVSFLLFTVGYILLMYLLWNHLGERLARVLAGQWFGVLAFSLGSFLLWFGIVFGFASRRFEQQADVYGALATGRVRRARGEREEEPERHPFVRALEGLSRQLGDIREVKGWRHFSLGERIDFLTRFLGSEAVRRRYRRGTAALLAFFFGLLAALGVAAAATVPDQLRQGEIRAAHLRREWKRMRIAREFERLVEQGRGEEAIEFAREAGLRVVDWREEALRFHSATLRPDLDPRERVEAHKRLAFAYTVLGQTSAARDTLHDLWGLGGDRPDVLQILGDFYRLEGRLSASRLAYEDARAMLPPDHPAAELLRQRIEELSKVAGD